MTIRDQIKRLRGLRCWSREDLAFLTGIGADRIGGIENGDVMPNLDELERIAAALGMIVWMLPAGDREDWREF